jgi:hypothetical protein
MSRHLNSIQLNNIDIAREDSRLRRLCERRYRFKLFSSPFWTAELYGFGLQISRYGFYPYFLPLCVYTDHGPGYYDEIPKHEKETLAPIKLYHSRKSVDLWPATRANEAACMYSPFAYCRRRNNISLSDKADGTIAFPAHSTPSIDDVTGYADYIASLKSLPQRFHPITVCLHMHDINKGLHIAFLEAGFSVETAGNSSNQEFIANFYTIISRFKYSTSSVAGSYLFYTIELGMPFFLHGPKPVWDNKGDQNIGKGRYAPWEVGYGKIVHDLFEVKDIDQYAPVISEAQRDFVEKHLGLVDGVSRWKMAGILYGSLLRYTFTSAGIQHLLKNNILALVIKQVIHHIEKLTGVKA